MSAPQPPSTPIFACIRSHRANAETVTRCNRVADVREFMFDDADHATDQYDNRNRRIPFSQLSVCHACADRVREKRKEDAEGHAK